MSINSAELSKQIKDVEGIDVTISAPLNAEFEPYPYVRAAWGNMNVTELKEKRLKPAAGGYNVEVFNGYGKTPHGGTKVETLRGTYHTNIAE